MARHRDRDEEGRLLPRPWNGNPETAPDEPWCDECKDHHSGACPHDGFEPTDADLHEIEHETERDGGERVDRRVCQGIGCPYGDH